MQIGTLTVGVDDAGHDVKFFGDTASAYMLWDASADDLVLAGAAGIDLAGDIDVDGTANLDAVDIDGAVQIDATFTSGVDGQGYDTKFFGDTSGAYILWDTSADKLLTAGGAVVDIVKDKLLIGGTAVTTTAAELNLLDAASANSVVNSKAVIYGSSGELAGTLSTAAQGNVTSLGTLTALQVDYINANGSTVTVTDSSDTGDYASLAVATHGATTLTTVDDDAAAANLNFVVDGAVDVDAAGAINLDSGSGIITFEDGGTEVLRLTEGNSGDVTVKLVTNAKDLIFTDNGDATNMKILDAAAGINVPGEVQTTGIGYTDGDNAMTIADGGGVTFAQDVDLSNNDLLNVGNASAEWTSTAFKSYGTSGTDVGSGPDIQARFIDTTALGANNGAGLSLGGQPKSGEYWNYVALKAYKSTVTSDDVSGGLKIYTSNNKVMTERVDIDLDGKITFLGAVDIEGGFANGGGAPYDGVVDVGNGGNWTTIQAGDDDLDSGSYVMLVKSGTYSAGVTVSTNNAKIVVEPGTVIQGAIVLSGDNVTLVLGAGCDVQSTVTLSGANCSLICQNGVDLDGIIVSGNFGFVDGGGWDTLSHGGTANDGINVSGTDVIVQNISAQTSGNSHDACESSGERTTFDKIKVVGADRFGFLVSADEAKILNSVIADSGSENIFSTSTEGLIANNYCNSAGLDGIECDDAADNSVIIGNIVRDQASDAIEVSAACENCVVVGNRTDGAIADNSGTSTVSGNDTTAF